jgi:hypothetical protein
VQGVFVGDRVTEPGKSTGKSVAIRDERDLKSFVDVLLFLAILLFSAVALLAVALAAPLAIAATAIAGAVSALTARGAKSGGWRAAGV